MSLSSCTRALLRSRHVLLLMPMWLWLSLASGVHAETAPVVVWLGSAGGDGEARERALRLELEARGLMLLRADAGAGAEGTPAPAGPLSHEALARQTLVRTDADAVLWLEGDASRPVSWLRVVHQRSDVTEQAPLPHPPDAIAPELFAIAAASLLEQVLRPQHGAGGPGVEPPVAAPAPPSAASAQTAPAPAPAPPAPAPPPAAVDRESARAPAPVAAKDWFVQVGVALSLASMASGMEAATRPSVDQIFTMEDDRFFFDDRSAWVPDADSFDDFESPQQGIPRGVTPVPGNCPADGIATGPLDLEDEHGDPFEQIEPSNYCVRVEEPGFAKVPALRLLVGRWVLPRLALGVLYQGHFGIDAESFFGNQLFGLQGEYLALGGRGRGVTLSVLGELTAGRTETPAPSRRSGPSINALSGPFGVQAGALVRGWPMRQFALFASPTLGARFPEGQLLVDLRLGVEVPF